MLRFRNIIIILCVQYVLLVVISGIIELTSISRKSQEIINLVRTAGDMALEQSQLVDDFMSYGGRDSYSLRMPSADGNGFKEVDMFHAVFNRNSLEEGNKQDIFERLYGNDFKLLAMQLGSVRRPVRYFNPEGTGFDWYYIPTVAMMGVDYLPPTDSIIGVKDRYGNYTPQDHAYGLFDMYGMRDYIKTSGGREYYNTPVSLGITYFNEQLLGTLFMNNLDLLMRQKYEANLNRPEGGNGVLRGSTFADRVGDGLDLYDPINNGSFTILRHNKNSTSAGVQSYTGIQPLVLYKVIDMYDPANDQMLERIFGANKGTYSSKAQYLRSLDSERINPVTGMPYRSKPIVVARVTFYVDVVVPYFSLVFREMRSSFGEGVNLVDISDPTHSTVEGSRRISYTRYFAVTP